MGDSRDGWMRGRSWWDERLREIRQSSPYKQRDHDVEGRSRRGRAREGSTAVRRGTTSRSPPPQDGGGRTVTSPMPGGSGRASTSPDSFAQPSRAMSPKTKVLLQHQGATSPSTSAWNPERIKRDSKAWNEMLNSTGGSRDSGIAESESEPAANFSQAQSNPEKHHVRAVLNKLQAGWLAVRKVLATQARTSAVMPIDDFSIGFDDFAAAVEMAGVSATRMQLSAVFTLIDSDKCGIITLGELVAYLRREGLRVSAFHSKSSARETDKVRRALSEIFDHVVEVMVCWDLHGNNSTTLIDIGRGLRSLKIPGLDVNKVISEASSDCTLTEGVMHLKEFVRHFSWHALEPLPELATRYDNTKLQRAVVMGKVRAWKARQQPDHIDPDLIVVCSKLRAKWGTISSMFSAMRATGLDKRSPSGSNSTSSAHATISLSEWRAGIEACGLQLTHKQIERVYQLVDRGENGVSLNDLEEAMRLTGELAHGAARAGVTNGERWTTVPAKIKPGQESAKLRRLFSNIFDSPVEAVCFLAQARPTLTLNEMRNGLSRLGATNINTRVLMHELDALCIDGQLGWKRFVRHFAWQKRASAGGKDDVALFEHIKLHAMPDVYRKVETWKASRRSENSSEDRSDEESELVEDLRNRVKVYTGDKDHVNGVQFSRRSNQDAKDNLEHIRQRMGQLMRSGSPESNDGKHTRAAAPVREGEGTVDSRASQAVGHAGRKAFPNRKLTELAPSSEDEDASEEDLLGQVGKDMSVASKTSIGDGCGPLRVKDASNYDSDRESVEPETKCSDLVLEAFILRCGTEEVYETFCGQSETGAAFTVRGHLRRSMNLREFLSLLKGTGMMPDVVSKNDAVGVFQAASAPRSTCESASNITFPVFQGCIRRLAALKGYKLEEMLATRSPSFAKAFGVSEGVRSQLRGSVAKDMSQASSISSISLTSHRSPSKAPVSPFNIYTPALGDVGGGGRRHTGVGHGARGSAQTTRCITEPGIYEAISDKEAELMSVFEQRFATAAHFDNFCKDRETADEQPRMDQVGLLNLLAEYKLLPAIITRNEACAIYKAVTRGTPLHHAQGMTAAAFRECLRRVGAWKGFKLWGLSKTELAAIQDASSDASRHTGDDLSNVPTLASICKVSLPTSPSPSKPLARRSRSPVAPRSASASPSKDRRRSRSRHLEEIPEEVMKHIEKITGELLAANQQREALSRSELNLVKELAAASQIAASANRSGSTALGPEDGIEASMLQQELRLANSRADDLAERNRVLEKGAQDRAFVITTQQQALASLKARCHEAEVKCEQAEARAAALDFGGSIINEMQDGQGGGGGDAKDNSADLKQKLRMAEDDARSWRARYYSVVGPEEGQGGDGETSSGDADLWQELTDARAEINRLRTEVETIKEKRARDVLGVMQQRDEVSEEVDSLREINEALRRELARLKTEAAAESDAASSSEIQQLLSSRTNPLASEAAAAAPPDGDYRQEASVALDGAGAEATGEKGEMLLGLDVEPQIGDSVQMAVGFMANGAGHVVSVDEEGSSVLVKWRSGGTRRILTGQDGVYALALAKADSGEGRTDGVEGTGGP